MVESTEAVRNLVLDPASTTLHAAGIPQKGTATGPSLKNLATFTRPGQAIKILFPHPQSPSFLEHVSSRDIDEVIELRSNIVRATKSLLAKPGEVQIRWFLTEPWIDMLSNGKTTAWEIFGRDRSASENEGVQITSAVNLVSGLKTWFEFEWLRSLDAARELDWTQRQVFRTRAVFLDRDDTLIRDLHYFGDWRTATIEILPGVIEGLHLLTDHGFRLIVVSNQNAVGLHLHSRYELERLTQRIKNRFLKLGVNFDAFYYCEHTEGQRCTCRKPQPGMFLRAAADFQVRIADSFFIGDKASDSDVEGYLPDLRTLIASPANPFNVVAQSIVSSRADDINAATR